MIRGVNAVDFAAARSICRRHAKSFYFASHFLPEPKRSHAYAVYAFCRLLDDAVDESDGTAAMQQQLTRFERLLDAAYAGRAPPGAGEEAAALRAFSATVAACGIPQKHFRELADGCRMDLTISRYADWPALERYCYHVAGVVGVIMCYVFGLANGPAHARAVLMGNAMQLTNILRDVHEDFGRGRVYLPQDEMARFGVTDDDLATGASTPGLKALIGFEIARARVLYRAGAAGLSALRPDGSRQTAAVMAVVYAGILRAIERGGYDIFAGRARLSTVQKVLRIAPALRLAAREDGEPVPDVF
jgi:phytoene synthase